MSDVKFIVVEGIDGAGKSEACKLIKKWYESNNINVEYIGSVIDSTELGQQVRKFINDGIFTSMDIESQTLLMFATINEFIVKLLKPLQNEGFTVICDRYIYSTFVYQFDSKFVSSMCETFQSLAQPDLVFFIDTPATIAMSRVNKREVKDDIESVSLDEINSRIKKYRKLAESPSFVTINGALPLEEVEQHISYFLAHLHGLYID